MVECPRCGSEVDELHFLPPEVITHDILATIGADEPGSAQEACDGCIHHLMEA